MRIGGRIPHRVVDPVDNPHQIAGPVAQQRIEPAALFAPSDLLGIGPADRGDAVGIGQPALQKTEPAVEFQPVVAERLGRQTQSFGRRVWEQALIGEIVDGDDGAWPRPAGKGQIGGRQAGLPIMGMNDIGPPAGIDTLANPRRHPAQRSEPLLIVRPVGAIQAEIGIAGAVEQSRTVQDV